MPDIKTRDVVSSTIKTIDRSALAGQRMKDAYVQAKDKAEHGVYSSENTSEEYATNQMSDGISTDARNSLASFISARLPPNRSIKSMYLDKSVFVIVKVTSSGVGCAQSFRTSNMALILSFIP